MALQARLLSPNTITRPSATTTQSISSSSTSGQSSSVSREATTTPTYTEVEVMPPATFLQSADNLFDMARKVMIVVGVVGLGYQEGFRSSIVVPQRAKRQLRP